MHRTDDLRGFEQRLLAELREVVGEQGGPAPSSAPVSRNWRLHISWPLRRLAIVVPIAVIVAVALIVGPAIVAPESSKSSAFAVTVLDDGRVHVKVASDFDEGTRLQDRLAEAGVKAEVIAVRSHPALVGTIEFPQHQLPAQGVERGEGEFWIDPARFEGTVEVLIHTATKPGEEWIQAPSVFHPDEPLGEP